MTDLTYVTMCGLHCTLCSAHKRTPAQAQALKTTLEDEGMPDWGANLPNFKPFWDFLCNLCDPDNVCPGCRAGGGYPACEIRKCAQARKIELCPLCDDFPCDKIQAFAHIYPTLIIDGQRMKKIGVEAWIVEQNERARRGVIYADFRIPRDTT
ncbi:MAG: DUF3795 domain-containing protein [Anaerolineae bacterium]|nr:DUF3795 domain-containing protein [Anaerolineae bacterium]